MSGAHAFLAPSSAHRWRICALAPSLEARHPETEESPASLEGTAAHWVVQRTLEGAPPTIGDQAPNGVPTTREMLEGAELAQESIERALGQGWRTALVIERAVQIPRVHKRANWGTPDYYAWGPGGLHVWDYKFGHDVVEAFENWQLIDYVAGILDAAGVDGYAEQRTPVHMHVIQPRAHHRAGPVRSWSVKASDLRAHINILANQAAIATSPNPPATPSPVACKHCRGRHACEALQRSAYSAADQAKEGNAADLSPHALGLELRALTRAQALLDARVSGLQAEAEAAIKRGQLVPFWVMESTPGRLKWSKPTPEVLMLGQMMGFDLAAPPDAITPTQAKAAGMPAALVDAYSTRPSGTAKLKPDDGSKARLTFSPSVT